MAAPKLVNGQREALLQWLAADYDTALIRQWFADRGWPDLCRSTFKYYRSRHGTEIADKRVARHSRALSTGLALKEERVQRLKEHADALEAIKWQADERGRLWNERAWRETLDDIAREMGDRRTTIDLRVLREEAQKLADTLGLERDAVLAEAERIVSARAG